MEPKIIVIARTLNEINNIERFCTHYGFADQILITDGGSTDGTAGAARKFLHVKVKDVSHLQVDLNGVVITPEAPQTNMLIKWAKKEGADWIILDDIDCHPNSSLRRDARFILETAKKPSMFLYRLYLWGNDQYFPKYNEAGQSLWAWKPNEIDIYCEDSLTHGVLNIPGEYDRHYLMPPFVCLHRFAPDEATVQAKIKRYAAMGTPQVHPLQSIYAPPVALPDWAL